MQGRSGRNLRYMSADAPKVLIAGGGVAALEVLLGLSEVAAGRVDLTLMCPDDTFVYPPLAVAEPFGIAEAPVLSVDELAAEAGATRIRDSLAAVDSIASEVLTGSGRTIAFDILVIAIGARRIATIEDALTFTGAKDMGRYRDLLGELESGTVSSVAYVVPSGVTWALPLYELALLTADHLELTGAPRDRRLALVTPEQMPLRLLGLRASGDVSRLLADHHVRLVTSTHVAGYDGHELQLVPDGHVDAERVVALPRLEGPGTIGVPQDQNGFIRTDCHGLVEQTDNVFAAGDGTSFPIKQGAIAAQQAASVIAAIARRAGAIVEPRPFRPVMRGLLISPNGPLFMRAEVAGGRGDDFSTSRDPLWNSADKIPSTFLSKRMAVGNLLGRLPTTLPPISGAAA